MKAAVGIATAGRRDQVQLTLQQLARLNPLPDAIFVCPASTDDYEDDPPPELANRIRVVLGPRGLCAQRNAILAQCGDFDIITFFDDDFYPRSDYLAHVVRVFEAHPDAVGVTGHPERDGATGPGISHEEGLRIISEIERSSPDVGTVSAVHTTYGGYGCNMSFRLEPIVEHELAFDESLPLYGWLEDIDFSRRLSVYGRIVASKGLRGVHLGTKRARSPGKQLGYSQIVNPIYMLRKGSMDVPYAVKQIGRNVAKNVLRSLCPEPWVDRRGRLIGNAIGFVEVLLGSAHPERALQHR